MWIRRFHLILVPLLFSLLVIGCASSDGDDDDDDSSGSTSGTTDAITIGNVTISQNRITSSNSTLVLTIPDDLNAATSEMASIYLSTDETSACKTQSGAAIDLILAEACLLYQQFYLFSENLPSSLDGFSSVEDYVDVLKEDDPFTSFFPAQQFTEINSVLSGESAKIGFGASEFIGNIITDSTPLKISSIETLSRAWFDGLKVGDNLIASDGVSWINLTPDEAFALLPDEEGETVTLTVERDGQTLDIATAAEEHIGLLMGTNNDVAYLRVKEFTTKTGERVQEDFEALEAQFSGTINKLILDVRGNGGGSVSGTLEMVDYLIDNDIPAKTNPMLITDGTIDKNVVDYLGDYSTSNISNFSNSNFVLLFDTASASASEITAAALRDYSVATSIGTTTFGKGVSQNVLNLIDGSGLFVTSHNLLPPSMVSYHNVGVAPDIVLANSPVELGNDPQLEAGIQFLETGSVGSVSVSVAQARIVPQKIDPRFRKRQDFR